jgi:hypothetical protein
MQQLTLQLVKQDAAASAGSTCFKKRRKYPNSKRHLPSLPSYICFLEPEVKSRATKKRQKTNLLFRRLPGSSPARPVPKTSSEKTAENLDLLIGSLGVSGSLYAAGPVPQRDLSTGYPQLIC